MSAETPPAEDLLLIGMIAAPFGLNGQMKLKSTTDRPDYIGRRVRRVFIGPSHAAYHLTKLFEHKPGVLVLGLREVSHRDVADELRGQEVYISAADAAPLDPDEYFVHDLYNLAVFTADGAEVGKVRDVLSTGAGDILIIARAGQPDALVPIVRDFVAELDVAGGRVVITPIEGML